MPFNRKIKSSEPRARFSLSSNCDFGKLVLRLDERENIFGRQTQIYSASLVSRQFILSLDSSMKIKRIKQPEKLNSLTSNEKSKGCVFVLFIQLISTENVIYSLRASFSGLMSRVGVFNLQPLNSRQCQYTETKIFSLAYRFSIIQLIRCLPVCQVQTFNLPFAFFISCVYRNVQLQQRFKVLINFTLVLLCFMVQRRLSELGTITIERVENYML